MSHIDPESDVHASSPASGTSGRRGGGRRRFVRQKNVMLITSKQLTPAQSLRKREIRYAWLQGSRIPFFLLSAWAYLGLHNMWLSAIFFTISVPLPWIAVMVGNGQGEPRDERMKNVYKPQLLREQQAAWAQTQLTASAPSTLQALPAGAPASDDTATADAGVEDWMFDETTGVWVPASPRKTSDDDQAKVDDTDEVVDTLDVEATPVDDDDDLDQPEHPTQTHETPVSPSSGGGMFSRPAGKRFS